MDIEELKRLHADFPEINMSNFDVDDVAALNEWGIEVALMLPAIVAKLKAADRFSNDVESEVTSFLGYGDDGVVIVAIFKRPSRFHIWMMHLFFGWEYQPVKE